MPGAALIEFVKSHPGCFFLADRPQAGSINVIPFGNFAIDYLVTGIGGAPLGRMTEIFGPACVVGDTHVNYQVRTPGGRKQNSKGGTIQRLWERFHNQAPMGDGRGKWKRSAAAGAEFWTASVDDDGLIAQNRILNVLRTGMKECFRLITVSGEAISVTADHKFMVNGGYARLGDLSPGDQVLMSLGKALKPGRARCPERPVCYVSHHPLAPVKNVRAKVDRAGTKFQTYQYRVLRRARAAYEANMNGMSLSDYLARLNEGDIAGLSFLPQDKHVHHMDENFYNDDPSNLIALSAHDHGVLHAKTKSPPRRMTEFDTIKSIEPVGPQETFDVSMADPLNNYIANHFVTHNSGGKTTLALHLVASCQAMGEDVLYIDVEHALNLDYAQQLGVDTDSMALSQPETGEEAIELARAAAQSQAVRLIVIDSVANLVPKAELEGDIGDRSVGGQARLMSQACRTLTHVLAENQVCLVFINQERSRLQTGGYGPTTTTTGGMALPYYASLRLDVTNVGQLTQGDDRIGHKVKVTAVKNKLAPPHKKAEVELHYGYGYDNAVTLMNLAAEDTDLLTKSGNTWYFRKEKIGGSRAVAIDYLREHPEVTAEIEKALRSVYGYEEEEEAPSEG